MDDQRSGERRPLTTKAVYDHYTGNSFSDSERIARETDARQPFPLKRIARITHMVRFFPSAADEFRDQVLNDLFNANQIDVEQPYDPETRRLYLYDEIERLGREALNSNTRRPAGSSQVARLTDIYEQTTKVPPRNTHDTGGEPSNLNYPVTAIAEVGKLMDLFKEDGPLFPTEEERAEYEAKVADNHPLRFDPYQPGGDWTRCWMNFWKYGAGVSSAVGLRTFSETYGANQNFTVFEDFGRE